jgi:mono/diheme cytochrome c family protein
MRVRSMIGTSSTLWVIAALTVASADNGGVSMNGPASFSSQDGATLFRTICQGCHMSNAEGATGAAMYPALAHNPKLAAAAYPVYTVIQGRNAMPSFARYLSDEQVAAVVNYVRTHFGNDYKDAVSPVLVKAARATVP